MPRYDDVSPEFSGQSQRERLGSPHIRNPRHHDCYAWRHLSLVVEAKQLPKKDSSRIPEIVGNTIAKTHYACSLVCLTLSLAHDSLKSIETSWHIRLSNLVRHCHRKKKGGSKEDHLSLPGARFLASYVPCILSTTLRCKRQPAESHAITQGRCTSTFKSALHTTNHGGLHIRHHIDHFKCFIPRLNSNRKIDVCLTPIEMVISFYMNWNSISFKINEKLPIFQQKADNHHRRALNSHQNCQ